VSDSRAGYWGAVGSAWARRHPQRLWRAHSDAENRALLARWLPARCGRVLKTDAFDEAFGEGLIPVLRERAEETCLIDLSGSVLTEAKRKHPYARTAVADVRRLPFPDGAFEAVVSISTLDHFDSPAEIDASLAEIRRVLVPRGCLVVTLDNPENPVVGLRNRLPWTWLHRVGLVPYYVGATLDRRRLADALDRMGFDVTGLDAIQHVPRAPAVAGARLVTALGWPRGESGFLHGMSLFERLGGWRTRFRTGYFVAARGVRRGGSGS
jgi:SAM-dependent methyltransferase